MRSSEAEGLQLDEGSRSSRTRPFCRNILPLHYPSARDDPAPGPGSPATAPTSRWLWTKQLWVDILLLLLISCRPSEKPQGEEMLVWAVNKMEQSKAALSPVPKLGLTWTSRFLTWLCTLVQLLLAGTELQNEMKMAWLHFRMSVSRLLQMQ